MPTGSKRAIQDARIAAQAAELMSLGGGYRDQCMADNVEWTSSTTCAEEARSSCSGAQADMRARAAGLDEVRIWRSATATIRSSSALPATQAGSRPSSRDSGSSPATRLDALRGAGGEPRMAAARDGPAPLHARPAQERRRTLRSRPGSGGPTTCARIGRSRHRTGNSSRSSCPTRTMCSSTSIRPTHPHASSREVRGGHDPRRGARAGDHPRSLEGLLPKSPVARFGSGSTLRGCEPTREGHSRRPLR